MADKQNAAEMLKALQDFIQNPDEDIATMPIEEVKGRLASEGIDPLPLVKRVRERIGKSKAEALLTDAGKERQELLERTKAQRERKREAILSVKEKILQRLQDISLNQPAMASAYFSKFQESSDADLQTLLEDLELLDELDDETKRES